MYIFAEANWWKSRKSKADLIRSEIQANLRQIPFIVLSDVYKESRAILSNYEFSFFGQLTPISRPRKKVLYNRNKQLDTLKSFLKSHILTHSDNAALVISGPPGTGKTEAVNMTFCKSYFPGIKVLSINCMSLCSNKDIFNRITSLAWPYLTEKEQSLLQKNDICDALSSIFMNSKCYFVLVLDEAERLGSLLDQLQKWTRVAIIAITNNLSPQKYDTVHFPAYTEKEISSALSMMLNTDIKVFSSDALEFAARKVASNNNGDMRAAFALCRTAIDLVAIEAGYDFIPVSMRHVIYASRKTTVQEELQLPHKAVLVALLKKDIFSVNEAYSLLQVLIKRESLPLSLSVGEVGDVINSLESRGLVREYNSRKRIMTHSGREMAEKMKEKLL